MRLEDQLLLQEIVKSGIITSDVLETLQTMKKEKVLKVHPYAITPPKKAGSRWQTYVMDKETGLRKKVSAESDTVLIDKLYSIYFPLPKETLASLYSEWLKKRKSENINPRTIHRNENHWNKYYAKSPFIQIPLCRMKTEDIEAFLHKVIKDFYITVKELKNMEFILTDMLKMARKRGLMNTNPMADAEIKTEGCKPQSKLSSNERIYLPQEREAIFDAIQNSLKQNPSYTDCYAVALLFKLGLRIGEAAALKWSDIDFEKGAVHIQRMESLRQNESDALRPAVVEYTKKKSIHGNRFLPLDAYDISLLKSVKQINEDNDYLENEFVFCDKDGRTKIREIDNCIRTLCKKAGIPIKSAHDIRRTVASEMFNTGNIPIEIIRDYLGHSDIKTTWGYILNTKTEDETRAIILESLKELNMLAPDKDIA